MSTTEPVERGSRTEAWTWVAVSAVALALISVQTPLSTTIYGVPLAAAFSLTVLHVGALPLALRWPVAAGVVSVIAVCGLLWLSAPTPEAPWPWAVAPEITQFFLVFLLAFRAPWQIGSTIFGLSAAGSIVIALLHGGGNADAATANIVVFISIGAGVLGVGIAVRQWRRIRTQLVREQRINAEELSRRVIAEEKARLARDLHDVIAHSMSVINVQAASAPARLGGVEPRTADEFADIATQARTALREMRGLLDALRVDGDAPLVEPQHGLADIGVLVRQTAQAGADVRLQWSGSEKPALSAIAHLAGYRVVQEALSNALRHAPGATIEVAVDASDNTVAVRVRNSRPTGPATVVAGGGHGLVAMRERVRGAGGTVLAAPTDDGGFEVAAQFPATMEEASE
ncbi:histidine kinase [Microbacterium sp. HD4P20]|uniref:sensor histidine kinase n=1 Tax=Microbacterium sp. HD4P20 TaxID=2864874 RepID=UPI001C64287B|nr:histidine kinase [Microbacterium sp. HD4P20]MCP2634979.1 histidine kinase [Microbacterium sp. HD4P20]